MTRRPDHIPKRKAFPKGVKLAVLYRSQGICEADGCTKAGKDFDHIKAVAVGGEITLGNMRAERRTARASNLNPTGPPKGHAHYQLTRTVKGSETDD